YHTVNGRLIFSCLDYQWFCLCEGHDDLKLDRLPYREGHDGLKLGKSTIP
mgnify:CR=1